jgi:hypothetical protein
MSLNMAQITGAVGGVLAALGFWGLAAPDSLRKAALAFPRHKAAGWVLTVIALIWSVQALQELSLGGLDIWKKRAFYAIPVAAYLIIVHLDELLAVRALGGILLLLPTPWLYHARWEESAWSYLPRVLSYVFVVLGMYFVATPYRFRQWLGPCLEGPVRIRALGAVFALLGLTHLALAALVF